MESDRKIKSYKPYKPYIPFKPSKKEMRQFLTAVFVMNICMTIVLLIIQYVQHYNLENAIVFSLPGWILLFLLIVSYLCDDDK